MVRFVLCIDGSRSLTTTKSRLARILLGSILVDCSNVIINGKGRRYRGKWQERRVTRDDVFARFEAAVARAVEDLNGFDERWDSTHQVFTADARSHLTAIPTCDLAIFSPPYPNSFDYTDVYNLELWMLGLSSVGAGTTGACGSVPSAHMSK